jgi:hypothetical protein
MELRRLFHHADENRNERQAFPLHIGIQSTTILPKEFFVPLPPGCGAKWD